MHPKLQKELVSLNKSFYSKVATHFSRSRQYSWAGWDKSLAFLSTQGFNPHSILDVGCGNGRFLDFLADKFVQFSYVGIDNSEKLLADAKQSHRNHQNNHLASKISFQQIDITNPIELEKIPGNFDLIVMMAVLHHIPGAKSRELLLKAITEKLNPEGILILTTWNFLTEPSLAKKIISWDKFSIKPKELKKELEQGDYLLDWNSDNTLLRYCHYFEAGEINTLIADLPLQILLEFESDGRNGKLNSYFVLRKS